MEERIQKIIAQRGGMSRRAAEKLIADGLVTLDGAAVSLGDKADSDTDGLAVRGEGLPPAPEKKYYIALNKPLGYVTTMSDERGRRTVAELVSDLPCRVYPVGRLDVDSEGLLLMTNDGDFANTVAHPSFEKDKTYRVSVNGDLRTGLRALRAPMELDGVRLGIPAVTVVKETRGGGTLELVIHEGRNRQVRRMCAAAGLQVTALTRISVGPVRLGRLKSGGWRNLTRDEVAALLCKK